MKMGSFWKLILLITAAAVLTIGAAARAESIPELTAFVQAQITVQEEAMAQSPTGEQPSNASFDEAWYYRRFWMRVRMPAGLDLPWVLKVQIVPEVELLWERQYPDGWTTYKP